ncbi:uncharacterized protein LOC107047619 [Diachasma alloeum]|uniref:uncharacterized protein LOC107047619 n=1 Tax=Diachasma alloeum TaxID=454923 RepID=UPI00073839BA|nr:uncharacterized protein LOC107047619 [Diachasma alloeum]
MKNLKVPRWYQDLSTPQMEMIFALGKLIRRDHEEKITDRTQKALRDIGITSTFVEIKPKDIRNLWIASDLDPVKFLCEIYRFITGSFFEEETYKKFYDCNERIVLSSIAFLKLPETIVELHRRLPMGRVHKLPPKPIPPKAVYQKRNEESPYLEYPVVRPNWRTYRSELKKWQRLRKGRVNPRVILPVPCLTGSEDLDLEIVDDFSQIGESPILKQKQTLEKKGQSIKRITSKTSTAASSLGLSKISGISSKKSKTLQREKSKALQSEKSTENTTTIEFEDENTVDPVETYQDKVDSYFAKLTKKSYPPGRENLSQKWQDFLLETDENFGMFEKEANIILKSVRESTKKIFNPDVCDGCCACRQIREMDTKAKESKNPNLVIDNVIADDTGKRYVVGSLGITSPAETISDDSLNKPLIIPSEDRILKISVIDSVTLNEKGQPIRITSGISKHVNHIPERVLQKSPLPRKNVPSCNCKSSNPEENSGNENSSPCAHEEAACTAQKYRKREFNKCGKCSESSDNKVFIEFERKSRERERREEEERINRHKQSGLNESDKTVQQDQIAVDEQEEIERCKRCSNSPDKCQRSPFKDVLDRLARKKEAEGERKKPSKKSGIKEYRDNLKFSLGGVASSNQFLLAGVTVHTPITITPVSSEPEIDVSAYDKHHHWSVTEFVPKAPAALKKIGKLSQDRKDKDKGRGKDSHQKVDAEIEELFDRVKKIDGIGETKIMKEDGKDVETIKATESVKIEINPKKVRVKKGDSSGLYDKKRKIERKEKKVKGKRKKNLPKLMKEALEEMAEEGYLFAKLPQCHKIPPLQTWILYRKGFKMTEKRKNLLEQTQKTWEACEAHLYKKIKAPTLHLSQAQKFALTWDQIQEIRRKIASKKKTFYSSVRKSRVLQSRAMWNLMIHDKNPNVNFKKSYYMYQASKEGDGYLLKPYGFEAA